ncbi:U-box domain-containing protein 4 [Hordeum vulgare]|nr:U-box domain-containing protein 4 [Hordeum vulgare]
MRTIRSALLHPDSPLGPSSRLRVVEDEGDSDIENLTNSVIDFHLSELATTAGLVHPTDVAKSSSTNVAATKKLDMSRTSPTTPASTLTSPGSSSDWPLWPACPDLTRWTSPPWI